METKFNVTHIGGRSGTIQFPKDTVFNDSINYSIFEPDETCTEQIKQSNPCAQVYTFCLDEKNGEKDFYLNLNKYTSSFKKTNNTNLKFYSHFESLCNSTKNISILIAMMFFLRDSNAPFNISYTEGPAVIDRKLISGIFFSFIK